MKDYAYVVILVGCYPSRDHPDFHHEYPKELLDVLGGHCLVLLIDPMYKKHPHKLPATAQKINETTYRIGSSTFTIFAGLAKEYDLSWYPEGTTLLYDFTGCPNVYDILTMCRLPPEFVYKYYIHFDAQGSSCMVKVQSLLPITDFRSVFTYLTRGGDISTLHKEEVKKTVLPIAREYGSWLRREHIFQTSQDDFYGREKYESILQTSKPVTDYVSWILSMMDQGDTTLERIELFYRRIVVFFDCNIPIRQVPLEKIGDLARALSSMR